MSSKSHTACERGASSRVHMSLVVFFFLFLASSQTQFENHMCASCSWLLALRSRVECAARVARDRPSRVSLLFQVLVQCVALSLPFAFSPVSCGNLISI